MRQVDGFVCIAKTTPYEHTMQLLFGRQGNHGQDGYENLVSNGLLPYETIEEAQAGQAALIERKDFESVTIGRLSLSIAESEPEIDSSEELAVSSSMIVIWSNDGGDQLMGRNIKGKPGNGVIPGAYMIFNGYEPILTLDSAKYIAWQTSRQSCGCYVTIATFSLIQV